MSKLRIAVVGAGQFGQNHLRVVRESPGAELAAVVVEGGEAGEFGDGAAVERAQFGEITEEAEGAAPVEAGGLIEPVGLGEQGIYYQGTRFLSDFELSFGPSRPLLLSSTVRADNSMFTADVSNLDMTSEDGVARTIFSAGVQSLATAYQVRSAVATACKACCRCTAA